MTADDFWTIARPSIVDRGALTSCASEYPNERSSSFDRFNCSVRLDRRELDFVFAGENFLLPEHPHMLAISDDFLCVVWSGNKAVRSKLTMEQYLALDHAITRYGLERRPGFEQYTLEQLGIRRRVGVSCTTPALLGPLVVGTKRIAAVPSRLAKQQARVLPLKLLQPPLDLPPLDIYMQWHRSRNMDGGTIWFRDLVVQTAQKLGYLAR